jgi:hypothetical protein
MQSVDIFSLMVSSHSPSNTGSKALGIADLTLLAVTVKGGSAPHGCLVACSPWQHHFFEDELSTSLILLPKQCKKLTQSDNVTSY